MTSGIARYAEELRLSSVVASTIELSLLQSPRKEDQDKLDALICLTIAWTWRHRPSAATMIIGDNASGYIVTPISNEIGDVLTAAAWRKGVPVDTPWGNDARRTSNPRGRDPH